MNKLILVLFFCATTLIGYTQSKADLEFINGVESVDIDIVKAAVAKGAKVNSKSEAGKPAICIALKKADTEILDYLFSLPGLKCSVVDDENKNPLHYAAKNDDLEKYVKKIITLGASVEGIDSDGKTPMLVAIDNENTAVIKILYESGASLSFKSKLEEGETTAFDYAVKSDCKECLDAFIDANITKEMAQVIFCTTKSISIMKTALAKGADVNAICSELNAPKVDELIYDDKTDMLIEFIFMKANFNAKSADGIPVLFSANKPNTFKFLIDNKVDLYAMDAKGRTILQEIIDVYLSNPIISGYAQGLDNIKMLVANKYVLPKDFAGKSILKYIDEHDGKAISLGNVKFNEESLKKVSEKNAEKKILLKDYLKSIGVK